MCAVLRTLRYEKHLWQFSLNYRLHSFLNLKMKQTETHKKETHIHRLFTGSRFITPKENPGDYPCIKIFSYGLSIQGGRGRGVNVVCLLHSAESERENLLRDRAYDVFGIPDVSKIKKLLTNLIINEKNH